MKAAAKLFYEEGIRSTSVDAISDKADVTKRTLYYHFKSKDELVEAYLLSQDQPTLAAYERWYAEAPGDVGEKIEGLFHAFAAASAKPGWRGCGFLRTSAELAATPGHPAIKAGATHKKRFEAWLRDILEQDGHPDPAIASQQILVLLDGAASVMLIHRDEAYVKAAGAAAKALAGRRG
ncbi:TetR/AcrR family transcriptional regulator [Nisaea acidiphila]|uniref:TetR/AcrR family transcriptional regulator n=1 Tax=Nisaea acidiphila TaxID=1862145 RepID=A0A9J7ARL0_9PROT|nr:TetR/AcrR family transcriptional regulator [Nisaea acidiphila]UUX49887.1 TetR/AcrR family transcriptional regulator [Nisaea acidiphila]